MRRLFWALLTALHVLAANATHDKSSSHGSSFREGDSTVVVLRWASSGGGWRAMMSNVGYANAFVQAGIINTNSSSHGASRHRFTAISSNSGGAWFAAQFFFSPVFFSRTVDSNVTHVREFILAWLKSYRSFLVQNRRRVNHDRNVWDKRIFHFLAGLMDANMRDVLDSLRPCRWSYADFVRDMLRRTSTDYGDPTLIDRSTSAMNRVPALNGTDLLVQTSLAANSRFASRVSYVTFHSQDRPLAVPIPVQYAVKMNQTYFQYAVSNDSQDIPLMTHVKKAPRSFSYRDWSHFHLYPPRGEQVDIMVASPKDSSNSRNTRRRVPLAAPFGGSTPTVAQIAAIASAALPHYAASTPSIMAQFFSVKRYDVTQSKRFFSRIGHKAAEMLVAKFLYTSRLANELAVCTQWPLECGAQDGRFLDGSFTDGPSLAGSIGQYQTNDRGSLNSTLKIILTNNNYYTDSNVRFLSYFNTTFNKGVEPGGFVWPPGTIANGVSAQEAPWRSTQIFGDYLDNESMLDAFEQIQDADGLTSAVYRVTTIDIAAFGVKAGQAVEILLLQTNSKVPTNLFTIRNVDLYAVPIADLAFSIVNSRELVRRIKSFLEK